MISQHTRRCQRPRLALKFYRPPLRSTASKDRELITLHVFLKKLETTMSSLKLMRMLFRGQPLQHKGGNVQMVKAKFEF
jgi:hypothetical protein